ncbi:hypothetical protein YC2023_105684 [Brassica napus]
MGQMLLTNTIFFGPRVFLVWVPHLRGSFPWARLGSGPLHPGGLYLGWGQGPTPSTAFDDRMGSSPPLGVEPVSMTIGPQGPYQVSYHIPSNVIHMLFSLL